MVSKIQKARRAIWSALGSCPKCGYGFAGKKPENGKMVKLSPEDPKFDPTKPCPNCELGLDDRGGEEKKESPAGFGEKYFIFGPEAEVVGPYYDKQVAEEDKSEFEKIGTKMYEWLPEETLLPDNIEHFVLSERDIEVAFSDSFDESEGGYERGLQSPREYKKALIDTLDHFKDEYFQRKEPKEPNTAQRINKMKPKNTLSHIKSARRYIRTLLADKAFEDKLTEDYQKSLARKELEKEERKKERQEAVEKGEYNPRPKKPASERSQEEHAKATHSTLDKQYERDRWKETLKKNIILLEKGKDDTQIGEIEHMLLTILNQPGDTPEIRSQKAFAKSVMGNEDTSAPAELTKLDSSPVSTSEEFKQWSRNLDTELGAGEESDREDLAQKKKEKTSSFADDLEKAKKIHEKKKQKEMEEKENRVTTKKHYTTEALRNLEEEMKQRLEEKDKKKYSPYSGWKRVSPSKGEPGTEGYIPSRTFYKLSGPQLQAILDMYERVLQRKVKPPKEKKAPKILTDQNKEQTLFSDDELAAMGIDLNDL